MSVTTTPPDGFGETGHRLWADLHPQLTAEPWKWTLLVQAARCADGLEWLAALVEDVDLSNTERRLALAEAGRQRTVLSRLIEQLKPADSSAAQSTVAGNRLEQLRRNLPRRPL